MILSGDEVIVIGKDGANLRRAPGLDQRIKELMPFGATLTAFFDVAEQANNYNWVLCNRGGVWGYVAATLIAKVKPASPLFVGIHFAFSGNLGNSISTIESMAKGGYSPPAVLVVSDPGLCKTIKEIDPNILVVYRWVESENDQPPMTGDENSRPPNGADWYNQLFRRHSQAVPFADLHQLHNEITFVGNGQSRDYAKRFNQFCMEMMEKATSEGQRVTFGNFNPGVPEQRHIDEMRESFAYAEQHGHWLLYHPYTDPRADHSFFSKITVDGKEVLTTPYFGLRPVQWVQPFPRLNVIGGESAHYNSPRYRGVEDFRSLMNEMHSMVQPYNNGVRRWLMLEWTLRGLNHPAWKFDDWSEALAVYAAESKLLAGK